MSVVVLDASIAISWLFEDEASTVTDRLLERIRDEGAIVPGLWHLELGNVLLQAERRKRIGVDDVAVRLNLIADLPIVVDHETTGRAWREILFLARSVGLTTYDATYLELALRRKASLLTKDSELVRAAKGFDIEVLP